MDMDEIMPGLDVIYYCKTQTGHWRRNAPATKLAARVIKVGKSRVMIQLEADGTFRHVEPGSLKAYKRVSP